jgi:pyridinium-3,5-biscarboxylic acid mononucleotide synthase
VQLTRAELELLALRLAEGNLSVSAFLDAALAGQTAELGDVTLDLDRARRCGFPEVVWGEGKSVETIQRIFVAQQAAGEPCLATRVPLETAAPLQVEFPLGIHNSLARTFRVDSPDRVKSIAAHVAVVAAGTTDLPVAEEAKETLLWMGVTVTSINDVGVAGPQRIVPHLPSLRSQDAIVVVAGLEAALASVVGGHVPCPVIACPTSIGYGAAFGGVTALLGMLVSCASNVVVVNIDAGFKAGYVAGLFATKLANAREAHHAQ